MLYYRWSNSCSACVIRIFDAILLLTTSVKTKKLASTNANRQSTPMLKAQQNPKARLLQKLSAAAEAARSRVSGYSDAKRSDLEKLAREMIQGVSAKQV